MENQLVIARGENLLKYIPQRPPFVMVDCLYLADAKRVRTGFSATAETIFSRDGFFTEPGLIENMAQSAAAGTGYIYSTKGIPVPVGFIGAIKDFQLNRLPKINERLITDVSMIAEVLNATVIYAQVTANDEIIASCEMKIFLVDPGLKPAA